VRTKLLRRFRKLLAEDTEALKHEFFFRGFFKKRGFYNLDDVTPAEYLKACERQKDIGTRKWLHASSLVISGEWSGGAVGGRTSPDRRPGFFDCGVLAFIAATVAVVDGSQATD